MKEKNLIACLAFCPVLFFLPMVKDVKDDVVANNSAQQGLTLLVLFIAANVLGSIIVYIPFISGLLILAITAVQYLLTACTVIGMVRAYRNKIWKLPLVGDIDIMKKIKGE